jgi:hypothetical protein
MIADCGWRTKTSARVKLLLDQSNLQLQVFRKRLAESGNCAMMTHGLQAENGFSALCWWGLSR